MDFLFISADPSCLNDLAIFDLSNNYLYSIPTLFIRYLSNLKELYLQNNNIAGLDLALLVLIPGPIDLSNNRISMITNNVNLNISSYTDIISSSINLSNNTPVINLSDAIYEMFGACNEVQVNSSTFPSILPLLTIGLEKINFGASRVICNCDQYYTRRSIIHVFTANLTETQKLPDIMCTSGEYLYNSSNTSACLSSTVNFIDVVPRLCKIRPDQGSLTSTNVTQNISIVR